MTPVSAKGEGEGERWKAREKVREKVRGGRRGRRGARVEVLSRRLKEASGHTFKTRMRA